MISTVAPDADGVLHNLNADTAAAALAIALNARKLVVLTDVPGLYAHWPDDVQPGLRRSARTSWPKLLPTPGVGHGAEDGGLPAGGAGRGARRARRRRPGRRTRSCWKSSPRRDSERWWCAAVTDSHRRTLVARASMMDNYGTPPLALVRGEGAVVGRRGRQVLSSTCSAGSRSTCSATPTRRWSPPSRRRSPPSGTSPTSTSPSRRWPWPSCCWPWPAGPAGCSSATPAPRPTRRRSSCPGSPGAPGWSPPQGGFHGRTMGALALTGQPAKADPFRPLPGEVTHVRVRRRRGAARPRSPTTPRW